MAFSEFANNGLESGVRKLFRRCVQNCKPPNPCPQCPSGQVCLQVSLSCDHCAHRKCVPAAQSGISIPHSTDSSGGGPNIGAIVGGAVAGLIVIIAIFWLVWRFVIKPRQQRWGIDSDETYEPYLEKESPVAYAPTASPEKRGSQFTRRSVASTTYTRGSNVIQIAFIPGITDRSGEDDAFVPPVPPIPIRTATSTPQSPQSPYTDTAEDHYFMPGDLRDSHYSGFTDDAASTFNRQSTAPSIAPSLLRQSVASTNHQANVENPAPAQTAQRGRPLVVSVKSSQPNSRSPSTPSVPKVDYEKYGQPQPIRPSAATPGVLADNASATSYQTAGDMSPPVRNIDTVTSTSSIPAIKVDTASLSSRQQTPPQLIKSEDDKVRADLKTAIEEATRQASRQPVHGGLGSVRRDPSPFSDENRLSDAS